MPCLRHSRQEGETPETVQHIVKEEKTPVIGEAIPFVSLQIVMSYTSGRSFSEKVMMNRDQMKDMMQRMMPGMLPPAIKPEDLPDPNSLGAKLLVRYCTQCHGLPSPKMHSAEDWPLATNRMFARMSMMSGMMDIENPSLEERQAIVAYLKANVLKSISPSGLPAPESKGALLFKDTCSQCHSIPDPKLHTAQEWPKVVERMTSNMQAMGRRVITEDEKKEILSYLTAYSRK
jgi:cytochrome c5